MRKVRLESSTDSEFDQRVAETQGYRVLELTIAVSGPPVRGDDGGTEHAEPTVEIVPGKELRENMGIYNRGVQQFKQDTPDFQQAVTQLISQLAEQDVPIPLRMVIGDAILRQKNYCET